MVEGTLYGAADSFRTQRVLVASKYSKANVKLTPVQIGVSNRTKEFTAKFPFGKIPCFEGTDGTLLFESSAIAFHVANDQLRGGKETAKVLQWISFADTELLPPLMGWVLPSMSYMALNKTEFERSKTDTLNMLERLNEHLLLRTFLVGERITLADIVMGCNLLLAYKNVLEPSVRKPFMNVTRWLETLIHQPEFAAVLGKVNLCNKAEVFDGAKFKQNAPAGGDGKAAGGKKEKEKKPAQEKKEAPKKKEQKKSESKEEMDETELALAQEEKKKDPFDAFPKGTFVMDDFKRSYSNEDEDVSIAHFWKTFDKEAFSIWHCEYKYPEDLSLVFMTCNLVGGMYQRIDKMRKNAFGSMCVFGEDKKNTIAGLWVWRGPELAFTLSPDWQIDYESYEWKKLDPNSAETKKMVEDYFKWQGEFKGMKFNQGKIFK